MIFISHFAFSKLLLWLLLCLLLLGWLNGHGNTINSVPMRKNNGQTHTQNRQTQKLPRSYVYAETSTQKCLRRNVYKASSTQKHLRRHSITAKLIDCICGLHSAQQPSTTHTSTELGGGFLGRGSSYQLLLMQSKTTVWRFSFQPLTRSAKPPCFMAL